jgi:antitoxin (DNA-binding transcriptional repressor) of toxin-antitoxin stability system
MRQINMHEAKTNLSALVKEAACGDPFVIAIAGHPQVKVVPIGNGKTTPRIGFLNGMTVPNDFNEMGQHEILAMFEGDKV